MLFPCLLWVTGLWIVGVVADNGLLPPLLPRLVGLIEIVELDEKIEMPRQIHSKPHSKLVVDVAGLPAYAVNDVGNNLNIYNLSNFKICLTEELMINIIHVVQLLSIWCATIDSLSYDVESSLDPTSRCITSNLIFLIRVKSSKS
jgi:hypothetical protein